MIVDMLLWATDNAPGKVDMVLISRVLDPSLADAIHQLHIRNYNIVLSTSFPPNNMTQLQQYVPPKIKTLDQMYPESLVNGVKKVAEKEKSSISERNHDEALNIPSDSQSQQHQLPTVCSILMGNCKTLVEEYLQDGITEFLEYDLYSRFMSRFKTKLSFKRVGFEKIDEFLQVAVPGINFKSILVGSRPWILCDSPGLDYGGRPSRLASEPARVATPPRQDISYYGSITMDEVRNWLQELVDSGRANAGINLSNLGKDFEDRMGKKLGYKSLHCPNLLTLLSKFENLVRLERKLSMVFLFPTVFRRARTTVSENVPMHRPSKREVPALSPSMQRIVQAQIQTNITRNVPPAMPVPKIFSMAPIPTTVRTPTTEASFKAPSSVALFTPEVNAAQVIAEQVNPVAAPSTSAGEVTAKVEDTLLSQKEHKPPPSIREILAANKSDFVASRTTIKKDPDPVMDAKTTSETTVKKVARQNSLPNTNTPGVPTLGTDKVHQAQNGEAKAGKFSDTGNGKKFDYYSFTSTAEEREAIKRTFSSVNRRLREEFKKRKLEQTPPLADRQNHTP